MSDSNKDVQSFPPSVPQEFSRGVIHDQQLNNQNVSASIEQVSFENGFFRNSTFSNGGKQVQFRNCVFENCKFCGNWKDIDFFTCTLNSMLFESGTIQNIKIVGGTGTRLSFSNVSGQIIDILEQKNLALNAIGSNFDRFRLFKSDLCLTLKGGEWKSSSIKDSTLRGLMSDVQWISGGEWNTVNCRLILTNTLFGNHRFQGVKVDIKEVSTQTWDDTTICHSVCTECQFNHLSLKRSRISYTQFQNCEMKFGDYDWSVLNNVTLTDSDWSQSRFPQAKMTDVLLESVKENGCEWNDCLFQNVRRSKETSNTGSLFFVQNPSTHYSEQYSFELELHERRINHADSAEKDPKKKTTSTILTTTTPITNSTFQNQTFRIHSSLEQRIEFISLKATSTSFFSGVFPLSVNTNINEIVSYICLGHRLFVYDPQPWEYTGTTGFHAVRDQRQKNKSRTKSF